MKKGKQIQWGEAVNRNSTDLPHALHLATGSGNGFEGAFDKIPGGESGLGDRYRASASPLPGEGEGGCPFSTRYKISSNRPNGRTWNCGLG